MENTNNHRFFPTRNGYRSRPATQGELEKARILAQGAIAENDFQMRSCWQCNGSHTRFLHNVKDFVFVCFECERWYANNIDVTDYAE
jgi:hypothetical protein